MVKNDVKKYKARGKKKNGWGGLVLHRVVWEGFYNKVVQTSWIRSVSGQFKEASSLAMGSGKTVS